MTGTHSGALKPVWAAQRLGAGRLLLWRDPGRVPRSPALWGAGGGRPLHVDPFPAPHLSLPFASKMDSSRPLLGLPCHHPSCPPALPPAHGLPSHGLARGGSGGVRQSLRLPAGEPPPGAPSGGKAASSPGPGRSLSGVGAGRRAWPQELLASESLPGSASLVPAHCAHCLRLRDAARTPRRLFSLALCSPTWGSAGSSGPEWNSRATDTPPPLQHRVRDALAPSGGHLP